MILFLAGTSDARNLALEVQKSGYPLLATVVTESGANELINAGIDARVGRLTEIEFSQLIIERNFKVVIDASHPFAVEASKNAMNGALMADVPYIRYERKKLDYENHNIIKVETYEEAANVAAKLRGVIFLATGSKTLEIFVEKLLHLPSTRMIARMLPRLDNMEKCEKLGIPQKNIVAIQGPFTKEFDIALYRQLGVEVLVTKESGKEGSVKEKLEAAFELGIKTILIKRPNINYGTVFSQSEEIIEHLKRLNIKNIN